MKPIELTISGRTAFDDTVGGELRAASIETVQVNIGLTCNLACHHCHVESSPNRTEQMSRRLNTIGYGIEPDLPLELVYNPLGPSLPPVQKKLEADYHRELEQRFGIQFTRRSRSRY